MPTIPAQVDVRTRGGKTTVKLTAAGKATLDRIEVLIDEIASNAAVGGILKANASDIIAAVTRLRASFDPPATPVAGTTERAAS